MSNQVKNSQTTLSPGPRWGGAGRFGPKVKPKDTVGTLKKLWHYFDSEKRPLFFILCTVILHSSLALLIPFFVGRAVDAYTGLNELVDWSSLHKILFILIAVHLLNAGLSLFQGWSVAYLSQRIVKLMRDTLFIKLQKLPISFFDTRSTGEIMSRLTNDIDNVSSTISSSLTALISGVFTILGTFVMMLILSPILTAASMIIIPLVFLLTKFVAKKTSKLFRDQQRILGQLNGLIEESVSGIEVVRAFNQEDSFITNFEHSNNQLRTVGVKAMIYSGFLMPLMNVIANFGFAVVSVLGGILAVNGLITVGVIAAFLTYSRQFSRPLNDIANIFNTLQSAIAGAERVFDIMDEPIEKIDDEDAIVAGNFEGRVMFNDVTFGYSKDKPIIKNVNFCIPPGITVAIVGPTGAGKTTIVNLLTRFYEVTSGEILIDGININSYTRSSLRQNFGMVLQDTYLFSGTIMQNLRYGKINASDEEIYQAAKRAASHSFIQNLPDGYETLLIEGGSNISQGQRQLLAITRAILADPSILILDEATSSIDTRTELKIQNALLELMKGRTSFVIAHRLSTIREADIIMVIDNGSILEIGTHDELIQLNGFYAKMYETQTQS